MAESRGRQLAPLSTQVRSASLTPGAFIGSGAWAVFPVLTAILSDQVPDTRYSAQNCSRFSDTQDRDGA